MEELFFTKKVCGFVVISEVEMCEKGFKVTVEAHDPL